jgi:hypothetical protein
LSWSSKVIDAEQDYQVESIYDTMLRSSVYRAKMIASALRDGKILLIVGHTVILTKQRGCFVANGWAATRPWRSAIISKCTIRPSHKISKSGISEIPSISGCTLWSAKPSPEAKAKGSQSCEGSYFGSVPAAFNPHRQEYKGTKGDMDATIYDKESKEQAVA